MKELLLKKSRLILCLGMFGILPVLISCGSNVNEEPRNTRIRQDSSMNAPLSYELAATIFRLPVHCIPVEYPNKLGQVLGSEQDLKGPKALRPIFYGCFDWHSSVHGYWSVVELLQYYPSLDANGAVRAMLNEHITPENVAIELAFFNDPNNLTFERTYGWAWLFKLQESLKNWNDEDAARWANNLEPLVQLIAERYQDYLPKLVYPIRTGQHDNTAFGLSLSLDYARSVGDVKFEASIKQHAERMFMTDSLFDFSYEPSGYDFLSPGLEEAYLMRKVLTKDVFIDWLQGFHPALFHKNFRLEPAEVKDRTDGKLVHLDGLNYSRATSLYGISSGFSSLGHLQDLAKEHIDFSVPNLSIDDDYMGSHWLGTFALYALKHQK